MDLVKIFHLVLDLFAVFNSVLFIPRALDYEDDGSGLNRNSFPKNFVFGTASSAYQYEGAYEGDGKGLSIWDTYTHQHPERIVDGSNGDVAVNHYYQYKEDIALMKNMGMDAYRFSISWSRILPTGKLSGGVNENGIKFYNNLIDELISKGLQPFATLFHWDVPQQLEDAYGGFLSPRIVSDFQDYAELCYKEFGDRVKYWITLNEPWSLSRNGYDVGDLAPGRCFQSIGNCTAGNSATEPYITAHNQLLAHAAAVKVFRKKYQGGQKGKIGIVLNAVWMVPFSEAKTDKDAAQRALEFAYGWFMDPLTYGEYPKIMQSLVGNRLPRFTKLQSDIVKGSYDFIGLNYYTANYAANRNASVDAQESYSTDYRCDLTTEKNGVPIGPNTGSSWLHVYPSGILSLLKYTMQKYDNPIIYITENGVDEVNNSTLSLEEALADPMRIDYHRRHLSFVLRAIKEGVNLKGYFAWSLLDNFEWKYGYTVRYGINYVDFKTMKRYPKHSSVWFKNFLLH